MQKTEDYYAVLRGRKIGVFSGWSGPEGAAQHVDHFVGAAYSRFETLESAQVWLKDNNGQASENEALSYTARRVVQQRSEIPLLPEIKGTLVICRIVRKSPGDLYQWIVRINRGKERETIHGEDESKYPHRMLLQAVYEGMTRAKALSNALILLEDKYLVNMFNYGVVKKWATHGWRTQKGELVKNLDIWKLIFPIYKQLNPKIELMDRDPLRSSVQNSKNRGKKRKSVKRSRTKSRLKWSPHITPRRPTNPYTSRAKVEVDRRVRL
jgi:ribonuclease HI